MKRALLYCLLPALLLLLWIPADAAPAPLRLLLSDDLRALEPVLAAYAAANPGAPRVEASYEGVADIQAILRGADCPYDAVWLSNSIPLSMLSGGQRVTNSRFTAVSPVVFAVRQGKAEELNLTGELSVSDIVAAVKSGRLSFVLPSVTQTNSGLSAYLGILSALSGKPLVLTPEHLENEALRADLEALFSGVERSSGSDDYVADLVKNYGYDCIVASEASVIRLNQELAAAGKETMRLLYPADGVTMADAPLAYINQGNSAKQEAFLALQNYVLSPAGQEKLAGLGMRTDIGGLIAPEHYAIFREEWGIRHDAYINTIVYPSTAFIRQALTLYQELFRKPSFTVFCLDYSGSMTGEGHSQLLQAMEQILDPVKAGEQFLQFTPRDRVALVLFDDGIIDVLVGHGGQTAELLERLREYTPLGGTMLHKALLECLAQFTGADLSAYTPSIVAMTDGEASQDVFNQRSLTREYEDRQAGIPIFCIMFGNASNRQLLPLARLSQGQVFDGRENLEKAFRTVRGYN